MFVSSPLPTPLTSLCLHTMTAGLRRVSFDIEGTFTSYTNARDYALGVLLDTEDGITEESFAVYDTAGSGLVDCG
jgi:hypothetical protein